MASPSSPVASSSTISASVLPLPQPGKSILKKPPPPQARFFSISTFSKLLPTPTVPSSSNQNAPPLRRAHFILPKLQTVYSISTANPPSSPSGTEERKLAEQREAERRRTVVRGNSYTQDQDAWWSSEKVETFYRECCRGREEDPLPAISAALKSTAVINQARTVDLSGVQLTPYSAKAFGDVLTIEWGLRKLVLKDCDLDESSLRPILHALLITNSISFLSIASNRKLRAQAWRILGAFVTDASSLQFLDISGNILDKKSVEYLVASFKGSSPDLAPKGTSQTGPNLPKQPCVLSLRIDDCTLRPGALEVLAPAIRPSSLRNLSLRQNKITSTGGVALALLIKDYPDTIASQQASTPSPPGTPLSPTLSLHEPPISPTAVKKNDANSTAAQTTTYTPYVPKSRQRQRLLADSSGKGYPLITSSAQGGVTTRHTHPTGPSATLLDNIRALDTLPRLGCLRTLDLRGNEIRGGVSYIAQVLKRNRTLKVLNLSQNRLDMTGLLALAEALKYNSSLETLDLSRNPCCGPDLAGVTSLRTAFTLNSSLKRLFLSATSLTSDGAIALAEFLPESQSLFHLDLTNNSALDLAGIVALNAGLKKNTVMRCLDLDIPPGNEELSRLCREILNSCIRNTEVVEESLRKNDSQDVSGRGLGKGVWGMIEESVLARSLREKDGRETYSPLLEQAQHSLAALDHLLQSASEDDPTHSPLFQEAQDAQTEISGAISSLPTGPLLEAFLSVNDSLIERLHNAASPRTPSSGSPAPSRNGDSALTLDPNLMNGSYVNDEEMLSPRANKGKGRAPPEPESEKEFEAFKVGDTDEEDEAMSDKEVTSLSLGGLPSPSAERLGVPSPTERSRMWVEEEGEIFRKGQALLEPEDLESEFAGEQLRIELLEAQVERPPQRQITELEEGDSLEPMEPHPTSPRLTSPVESAVLRPIAHRTNSIEAV